jgi:hypothetical protein
MSDKEEGERGLRQRLLDIFEGARGRLPTNNRELHEGLASPSTKPRPYLSPHRLLAGRDRAIVGGRLADRTNAGGPSP